VYDLTNDELYEAIAFILRQQDRSCELGRFMNRFHVSCPQSRIFAEGYVSAGDYYHPPCAVTVTEKGLQFYDQVKQQREQKALQKALHADAQQTQLEIARKDARRSWIQSLIGLFFHRLFLVLSLILFLHLLH